MHLLTIHAMLIIMDSITKMRAFVAVAEEGSFAAAARRLGITPQLLSKYVQSLETDLGAVLLNRTTRKVNRTELGNLFFSRCVTLLEDYDDMRDQARQAHVMPRGLLTVSAPVTFGEIFLSDILSVFSEKYPEIRFDIQFTDKFVDLMAQRIDVAIRIGNLESSSLIAKKLATTERIMCASPEYLERAGRPKTINDLARHECIFDTNNQSGRQWNFLRNGQVQSVRVAGTFTVNSATAAIDLAKNGVGIIKTPDIFVGKELASGELMRIDVDGASETAGVYAVFHSARRPAAKIRAFVDFLGGALLPRIKTDRQG